MKTKQHIHRTHSTNHTLEVSRLRPGKPGRTNALLGGALMAGALLTASTAPASPFPNQRVGDVFVIALENHNFTQPNPTSSPQQILGNPAAPYLNSLITPGNSNAVQVSYATAYYNAGSGGPSFRAQLRLGRSGLGFRVSLGCRSQHRQRQHVLLQLAPPGQPADRQWQYPGILASESYPPSGRTVGRGRDSLEKLPGRRSIKSQPDEQRLGHQWPGQSL